jgi:hypothetical protein
VMQRLKLIQSVLFWGAGFALLVAQNTLDS